LTLDSSFAFPYNESTFGKRTFVILGDTIFSWLLAALLLLALLALSITIKSWREMKRSRYFFLRRQAEKRFQVYSLASLLLLLGTTLTSAFAFQTPADNTARVAILTNSKPPSQEIIAAVRPTGPAAALEIAPVERIAAEPRTLASDIPLQEPIEEPVIETEAGPNLPEAVAVSEQAGGVEEQASTIGVLRFSTEIGQNNQALSPGYIFSEGFYTLYATFDYADMADGIEWSWVWRRNGAVFDGGKEIWNYGQRGLGYVYLNPPDGFQNGEYELEVWVEGELLGQSSLTVNSAAVTAGN
jgi:hypothetical protein